MSEPHQHGEPQPSAAEIENAEVEEVVCEWDFDEPDPRSDHAAEIVESTYRRDEGRNVLATFSGTLNGEPVFTIRDLPSGQTAADVRKSKVETNTGIANFLRNAADADLDKLLAMIQAERTSRLSSKSKAARRAERKKRAAAKKQAKAERKKNAGAANADDWMF